MGAGKGKNRRISTRTTSNAGTRSSKPRKRSVQRGQSPADLNPPKNMTMPAYWRHVHKTRVLTREEENYLALQAKEGNIAAQNTLVEHNQLWAIKIARQYKNSGLEFDDLVQEANLGLMRAARDYDPDQGGSFLTYARHWVRHYIRRAMEQEGTRKRYGTRIPSYLYAVIEKTRKAQRGMETDEDKQNANKIAEIIDEPVERISGALEVMRRKIVSFGDAAPDEISNEVPSNDVTLESEKKQIQRILYKGLSALPEDEYLWVQERFGLLSGEPRLEKDVCAELGITRGKANYLQGQAINKLRTFFDEHELSSRFE